MSVGAQMVVVLKARVEHLMLFALGPGFVFAFVVVAQTDVFHCSSPLPVRGRDLSGSCLSRQGWGESTERETILTKFGRESGRNQGRKCPELGNGVYPPLPRVY